MAKPVWSLGQIVSQLTNWELRWDTQAPIAYAFYSQPYAFLGNPPGFSAFSDLQRQAMARHVELIADVANISFVNVADNGQEPGIDNQRIAFFNINYNNAPFWGIAQDFVTANADPPYGRMYGANSIVNLWRANVQGGWAIGESNPRKLMHELLHTLGLDHPGPYNGDSANYESQALFHQDSHQYTVMSYWTADMTGADHEANGLFYFASTPLLYDVASLQHLYGANMTTRTGDTIYGFNANAGRAVYDLAANPQSVFTIWDAGGRDRLDLSGYASPSSIDLHGGGFSDAGGLTDNISIAYGARIEDARGGSGADVILVNPASNQVWGGLGADRFVFQAAVDGMASVRRSDGKSIMPDRLEDFVSGTDRIDLSAIDADRTDPADDSFAYIGSAAFGHVAGQVRWETREGRAHIFADLDGDAVADMHVIASSPILSAADFIL